MLNRQRDADSGDNLLQEWMTATLIDVCRERPRALDTLRKTFGSSLVPFRKGEVPRADGQPALEWRRLCVNAIRLLWDEINRARGKEPVRGSDWQVFLYAISSARTIREAIQCWSYCCASFDGRLGQVRLHVRNGQAEVQLDELGVTRTVETALILLFSVAEYHSLLEWLIGRPLRLNRIHLSHDAGVLEGYGLPPMPIPVVMNAQWTGFAFAEYYLDYPVDWKEQSVMDRPGGNFLFSDETGRMRQDLAERVRRMAMRTLREHQRMPRFDAVAADVGMSAATLRRRLADQGASYRLIKDSCRRELALKLLRHSELPVEEIATRLDFGDSDTFRRTFRTWMGTSPSRFRSDLQGQP